MKPSSVSNCSIQNLSVFLDNVILTLVEKFNTTIQYFLQQYKHKQVYNNYYSMDNIIDIGTLAYNHNCCCNFVNITTIQLITVI